MRAFAISLTGNIDQADDLVQEAMVRGLAYISVGLARFHAR
jgi:RNA polymerase sigma-70 factor, ECF subfamily